MSKEYIDREAFKDEYLCCGYLPEMSEDEFDAFPAADVVMEVIRCRECKYSHEDEIFGNRWCESHYGCRKVKDEGFCDLGERKEGVD